MNRLELRFTYEKETKNTIRYKEELGDVAHSSKDIAVGTLYVQKEALGEPVPRRLSVTQHYSHSAFSLHRVTPAGYAAPSSVIADPIMALYEYPREVRSGKVKRLI